MEILSLLKNEEVWNLKDMSLDILIKEILRHTKDNLKTINSLKQLEKFVEEANGKIIEYELIIKD